MPELIKLSPSGLGDLARCRRCFYDDKVLKTPHPRGIFPTLPGGMDRVLKGYFDNYRGNLPEILKGKVPGVLYKDLEMINRWRMWQRAPQYFDPDLNVILRGGIDDMLINGDVLTPLDVKTKGNLPKTDGSEYYQTQMDSYNLIFDQAGFKMSETAFLCYVYPDDVFLSTDPKMPIEESDPFLAVLFPIKIYELKCNMKRAKDIIAEACSLLRGPRPGPSSKCEYCVWAESVNAFKVKGVLS